MSILLRGQALEELSRILAHIENRLDQAAHSPSAFRKRGNWLIKEQYLDELIRSPRRQRQQHQLPGFFAPATFWGTCQLLWCRWLARRISAPISADAVRVKTNLRAFYLTDKPHTIKALLHGTVRNQQTFNNEIDVRQKITAWAGVNLPRLISFDRESEVPFINEELIWGHMPQRKTDQSLILSELVPQLFGLYRNFGLVWQPLDEVFDRDSLLRQMRESIKNIKWNETWPGKPNFIDALTKKVSESSGLVPCCLCHGDLSFGNLVVSKERKIYLVDWEMAKVQPIAFDLFGLLKPTNEDIIVSRLMEELSPPDDINKIMPLRDQYLFAALTRINRTAALGANSSSERKKAKLNGKVQDSFARMVSLLG